MDLIRNRFESFGFPLIIDRNVIPDDDSTLFICSGMQRVKDRFLNPDGSKHGSLQSCIRTNDLESVGDGSHLTYFEMLGNFSFGGNDYEISVEMWHSIIKDLRIPISEVRVHPDRMDHKSMWIKRGYHVVNDRKCQWSDGNIHGECCELFRSNMEVGNLVNPLRHSTDVGFGWERLIQILENKHRVDETSLFDQTLDPVVRDYCRTLRVLRECGVTPGPKGKEYVCRRLLRKVLHCQLDGLQDWIDSERELRDRNLKLVQRLSKRYGNKPPEWWHKTFGILPVDL